MLLRHICSAVLIFYPIREDIREKKIWIPPAICCVILGLTAEMFFGSKDVSLWIYGWLPGFACAVISRIFGRCIGDGDSALLVGVGLLEGAAFCARLLAVAGSAIFLFSFGMMMTGHLRRASSVACVPFLAVGYVGAWIL